jgi:hypothetical protein
MTETLPNDVKELCDKTLVIVCEENKKNKSVAGPSAIMAKLVTGNANETTEFRVGFTRKVMNLDLK